MIIENKPGAGGISAGDTVAKSDPDGHTLLLMSNATAVSAGLFKSLPEMLAYAKANPGKLNVATVNIGSTQHLAAELLKTSAGVDFQVVPFNGSPAVLTALRGGQVDAAVEILGPIMGQIASKAVRPLAVMGARRAPGLPDVPTVAESGVRGFDASSWNALAAPARTPPQVVALLNREANKALANADLRKQLAGLNVTPAGGTPDQLRDLLASETRRWSEVIARANVPRQ